MSTVINAYMVDEWDSLVLHRPGAEVGYRVPLNALGAKREFRVDAAMLLAEHRLPGDHERLFAPSARNWADLAQEWQLVAFYDGDDSEVYPSRTTGLPTNVLLYLETP